MTRMARTTQSITLPKRFYLPRCLGLGLGFLAVFANLSAAHPQNGVLWTLIAYCFAWPHLAYLLARASARPVDMERRSMLLDAFASGFFAGAMGFNPIPTASVVTMTAMNNMAMGGPRFMLAAVGASMAGAAVALLTLHLPLATGMSQMQMVASLPLLVLYPLSLGYVCYLTALKLGKQKKQLGEMSRTDYLTGLANRAALNAILEESFAAPGDNLSDCVIALIDADGFKGINDRFGHLAGDRALQRISDIMRSCVRKDDTVGRYGGDEFCVILRHVTQLEAARILERMRALAQQSIAEQDGEACSTLSIGAAVYNAGARSAAMWIHLADEAMYEAKKAGRNKVVFASDTIAFQA
jgi:diguanylate cyclase